MRRRDVVGVDSHRAHRQAVRHADHHGGRRELREVGRHRQQNERDGGERGGRPGGPLPPQLVGDDARGRDHCEGRDARDGEDRARERRGVLQFALRVERQHRVRHLRSGELHKGGEEENRVGRAEVGMDVAGGAQIEERPLLGAALRAGDLLVQERDDEHDRRRSGVDGEQAAHAREVGQQAADGRAERHSRAADAHKRAHLPPALLAAHHIERGYLAPEHPRAHSRAPEELRDDDHRELRGQRGGETA